MGSLPFFANHIDIFGTGTGPDQLRHIIFEFKVSGRTVGHLEVTVTQALYDAWKKQFHDIYEREQAQLAAGEQPGKPVPEIELPPGSSN